MAKTTAQILSTNSGAGTFVSLKANEIITNTIGTSEKIILNTFEVAKTNVPCVIFIDEFQALFTSRDGHGSSNLATTLLQCMDDIKNWCDVDKEESDACNRIVVFAATNVPWMIDKAFLRTGRFDRVVYVGLPNFNERCEILHVYVHTMKLYCPDDQDEEEFMNKLCASIAKECEGYSGADLCALCRAAATRCLSSHLNEGEDDGVGIEEFHFMDALKHDVKPSCQEDVVNRIQRWRP